MRATKKDKAVTRSSVKTLNRTEMTKRLVGLLKRDEAVAVHDLETLTRI